MSPVLLNGLENYMYIRVVEGGRGAKKSESEREKIRRERRQNEEKGRDDDFAKPFLPPAVTGLMM